MKKEAFTLCKRYDDYRFFASSIYTDVLPMCFSDVPPRIDYKLTDPQVKGKSLLDLQMAPSVVFLVRWQNSVHNGKSDTPSTSFSF